MSLEFVTEEDRETMQQMVNENTGKIDARMLSQGNPVHLGTGSESAQRKVSREACDRLRFYAAQGMTREQLKDYFSVEASRSTIRRHITGECRCQNEKKPVEWNRSKHKWEVVE